MSCYCHLRVSYCSATNHHSLICAGHETLQLLEFLYFIYVVSGRPQGEIDIFFSILMILDERLKLAHCHPVFSLLMIDCGTAVWPTVERVSRQRLPPTRAAGVTACLGSEILSDTEINESVSLDMMATLSHLHWQCALTFFRCVCFSYLQAMRERKHLLAVAQQRICLII